MASWPQAATCHTPCTPQPYAPPGALATMDAMLTGSARSAPSTWPVCTLKGRDSRPTTARYSVSCRTVGRSNTSVLGRVASCTYACSRMRISTAPKESSPESISGASTSTLSPTSCEATCKTVSIPMAACDPSVSLWTRRDFASRFVKK
eukprot:scaffold2982_cov154-Isochrysis_galbana.AAC.8